MKDCPKCKEALIWRALVDSDERIWAKWLACRKCGFDSRYSCRGEVVCMLETVK